MTIFMCTAFPQILQGQRKLLYVVIKAYKLTVLEILRFFLYCHILHVRTIPTLESTNSVIHSFIHFLEEKPKALVITLRTCTIIQTVYMYITP